MHGVPRFTRTEYLQLRKEADRVAFRKLTVPHLLVGGTLIPLLAVCRKIDTPETKTQTYWFVALAACLLIGCVWTIIAQARDIKRRSIRCPSCKREHGGPLLSRILISSGSCSACGEKIFLDEQTAIPTPSSGALPSQADYLKKLADAKDSMNRAGLAAALPLVGVSLTMAYFNSDGILDWRLGLIWFLTAGLSVVGMLAGMNSATRRYSLACSKCGQTPFFRQTHKMVIATGNCWSCGNPVFQKATELLRNTQEFQ